jgi:hypothetical protein
MVFARKYSYGGVRYGVPAEVVGNVLGGIEDRDGGVTKEAFLEESRPESSPTHSMFEWNDAKAAEKYRLVQSKNIINNLRIEIQTDTSTPTVVKAFVNIQDKSQNSAGRYIRIERAVADEKSMGVLLRNAFAELGAFRRKYQGVKQLQAIFDAIDAMEDVGA